MTELIGFIVRNLVDEPDAVNIREVAGDKTEIYEVRVSPPDRGKLIGKHGRTVRALRSLVGVRASREGKRVLVEVLD